MKRYSSILFAALLMATSCVDHRYDYMVDDSAYFAKSDLQEETLSVMNAEDYVYEIWIHKSGYYQKEFAANLELDYNYLVQYNSANGTEYEMLDEKYYSFERNLRIPEGEDEAAVPLTLKTEQVLQEKGYGTYYIPISVNSRTPEKDVYIQKSHFILAITLERPSLKIDGRENANGDYIGEILVDANSMSGETYELDITSMLDVLSTEDLEVVYNEDESLLKEGEHKLESQYYSYNSNVIMPEGKQYAENYLTIDLTTMPDGKWVIPVRVSSTNVKVSVPSEKSWLRVSVVKGSLDEAIQCTGEYAQGNEIIISADKTLAGEVIASIGERQMTVSCVDNSTSEQPDWMSVAIEGSDVKLTVTGTNTSVLKEQVATITLTDTYSLLEKVITVRRCMDGYGTILNKNLWSLIDWKATPFSGTLDEDILHKMFNNFWPSDGTTGNSSYVEFKKSDDKNNPAVFTFDLGENVKPYNAFGVMPRLQWAGNSPKSVLIEVSDDNIEWKEMPSGYQKAFLSFDGIGYANPGTVWVKLSDEPITSRYMRFSMYESLGGTICIDEIFVSNIVF